MGVEKKSQKVVDFIDSMSFTADKPLIFQADEIEGFSTDCTATPMPQDTPEHRLLSWLRGIGPLLPLVS